MKVVRTSFQVSAPGWYREAGKPRCQMLFSGISDTHIIKYLAQAIAIEGAAVYIRVFRLCLHTADSI
jgi:hypothetical protein